MCGIGGCFILEALKELNVIPVLLKPDSKALLIASIFQGKRNAALRQATRRMAVVHMIT